MLDRDQTKGAAAGADETADLEIVLHGGRGEDTSGDRPEHPADAVRDGDLRARHLGRGDAFAVHPGHALVGVPQRDLRPRR